MVGHSFCEHIGKPGGSTNWSTKTDLPCRDACAELRCACSSVTPFRCPWLSCYPTDLVALLPQAQHFGTHFQHTLGMTRSVYHVLNHLRKLTCLNRPTQIDIDSIWYNLFGQFFMFACFCTNTSTTVTALLWGGAIQMYFTLHYITSVGKVLRPSVHKYTTVYTHVEKDSPSSSISQIGTVEIWKDILKMLLYTCFELQGHLMGLNEFSNLCRFLTILFTTWCGKIHEM